MNNALPQELFERFVSGTATAEETAQVQRWLADPTNQAAARDWMQQHWGLVTAAPAQALLGEPDYEVMLNTLHVRLGLEETTREEEVAVPRQPMRVVPMWRRWAAAAAMAGVLIGGGWLTYQQRTAQPTTAVALAKVFSYATAYGQTRRVTLPDGSLVTLNANSTLRFASAAPGKPRQAWLDGEGFFEVKHQADDRRFVVHTTAGLDVEVLGTRFSVYRRHEQARVVLVSGKVRVSFADERQPAVIMKPGDVVETRADQPRQVVQRAVAQPETFAAWKDGKLVLNETSIAELTTRMEDTYGVKVEVKTPALNQRRITGTVPVGDLDVLLLALQETFNLRIERQPGRIILSDKRASNSSL